MPRLLVIVLFAVIGATHCLAESRIDVLDEFQRAPLVAVVEAAEDAGRSWSLAEAMTQTYAPLASNSFGFSGSAIWLRFRIENRGGDRLLILDLGDRWFHSATLYVRAEGEFAQLSDATYGTAQPFSQRRLKSRTIAFPLLMHAGQVADIYLRIEGSSELKIAPVLYNDTEFYRLQFRDAVITYLFYGAMAALLIFNLFLAFGFRDRASFCCVALVFTWVVLGAATTGVLYQWWPSAMGQFRVRYVYVPVGFALCLLALFTKYYLELDRYRRTFTQLQHAIMLVSALYFCAMWFLPMRSLRDITLGLFAVVLLSEIILAALLIRRGSYYARNYLLGYVVTYVALLVALGAFYLPGGNYQALSFATQYSPALLLGTFTFGVADRIRRLKIETQENKQSALLARAEAEFKGRFLVTMSHEIRTPLNGVIGMIDLLSQTSLSDLQHRYADVISASGRALMDVINNVLDFSKLESGKLSLEILGINLQQLIDECIDVFAITKKSGRVAFNACIEPGTPLLIMSDPTRIKQILINFVGNAFKFTEVGEVNLSVRVAADDGRLGGAKELLFTITDTGVGMDSDARARLFAAFTQVDGSIARKYGGTGLGLAICKQLIDLMGGSVGVDSSVGIGSTFWFTLPLVLPNEGVAIEPPISAPMLVGKFALVIDDHDAFCHSILVALESFGMTVSIAQTAEAARACMVRQRYDVLIIDRCLPDSDGIDLALEIRGRMAADTPPMLLVTLALDVLDDRLLSDAGIVAHLIKPISLNNLRNRLARLFMSSAVEVDVNADASMQESSLRVLVAEDNSVNQIVLNGLLLKLGIHADFVGDGRQAIDRYLQGQRNPDKILDVIIMDYDMPVLDGVTATREIRRHELQHGLDRAVLIIGLTAYSIEEYFERGVAAGMNIVLTKPLQLAQLKLALMRAD